jgi:hypothetical protein
LIYINELQYLKALNLFNAVELLKLWTAAALLHQALKGALGAQTMNIRYYDRLRDLFDRLDRRTRGIIGVLLVIVVVCLIYAYKNSGGNDTSEEVTNAPPAARLVAPVPGSPITSAPATTSPQQ